MLLNLKGQLSHADMIFELRCHFLHESKSLKASTTSVPLQREDCDPRQLQTGVTRLEVKVRTLPRPRLAQSSLISKRRPPNSFQDGPPQKFMVNDVFSQRIACLKPRFRPNRGGSKRACGHLPCLRSRWSPTFSVPFA